MNKIKSLPQKPSNDIFFENMFKKAAHQYLEDDFLCDMPENAYIDKLSFTKKFIVKMDTVLTDAIRADRVQKTKTILKRIAAGLLLLGALSTVVVTGVDAFKQKNKFKVFIDYEIDNVRIFATTQDEVYEYSMEVNEKIPDFVPDRYTLETTENTEEYLHMHYINEKDASDYYDVYRFIQPYELDIDTKNAYSMFLKVEKHDVAIYRFDTLYRMVCKTDKYVYLISGYFTLEEGNEILFSAFN